MQVYVQKSIRTTLSRKLSLVKGDELSHPVAPPREGRLPSLKNEAAAILDVPKPEAAIAMPAERRN
jgi:hypothetical protein